VRLLQQPGDGVMPLVSGINNAKSSIYIHIFRFDQREIEKALANAVSRGVSVHALIAHLNSSNVVGLRKLEMRLLAAGVTVARTADTLARYHAKMMVIDETELYLLAFNFTNLDINRSRSFGLIVTDPKVVREALKLVEADTKRLPYEPGLDTFVVSPENARKQLSSFIEGAKRELSIYDLKISDPAMIRLLEQRAKAGVDIRVIGQVSSKKLTARSLSSLRLHARVIIRDGESAFVGSQSLRHMELDRRREAGMILDDSAIVKQLAKTFEEDWNLSERVIQQEMSEPAPPAASKVAKKVAKAVSRDLSPVTPVLEGVIKEVAGNGQNLALDPEEVEETVKDAVKDAVKQVVEQIVDEAQQNPNVKA
jgi:cardiolipin synthase